MTNTSSDISISVLIPIYNGAEYLANSIGSVITQTFTNWELIALDDGSSDNSYELLQQMAHNEPRIHLYNKKNDPTGNVARNIALMCKWAKGEYAFYMSQDDMLSPDCLELLYKRATEIDADIVLPDMLLRYANNHHDTWPCSYPPKKDHSLVLSPLEAFYLAADFSINGFGLVRMPLMADEHSDTRYYDSDEYNTRMQFLHANKVAFAPGTFYYYQGNPNAITHRFSMRRFQRLQTGMMLYDTYCKVFTDKQHRLKIMTELMHFYLDTTMLFYMHHDEMSATERKEALTLFKTFEQHINFRGYNKQIFSQLNTYERLFALPYYIFGTTRHTAWLYRLIHGLRKKRK